MSRYVIARDTRGRPTYRNSDGTVTGAQAYGLSGQRARDIAAARRLDRIEAIITELRNAIKGPK